MSLENPLLQYLVDFVKIEYLLKHNPLGIEDDMSTMIKGHNDNDFRHLHEFYVTLSGIFRFQYYNDNQLVFDFDGRDPNEKYSEQWEAVFKEWIKTFCKHHNFLRAVLDLTVFYPSNSPVVMADNRMNNFIHEFFELKIHPQKGILKKGVA